MDRQTRKLLHDALTATEEILADTGSVDLEGFLADTMRQRATYYAFAVLGEALNKVVQHDPSLSDVVTDRQLAVDMRNRLIHGYTSVDPVIIWAIAKTDIPNIQEELRALLGDSDAS